MHRIQIQLTQDQERRLRELAKLRGSSISALIREGVDRLIEPKVSALNRNWERANAVVGKYRSAEPTNVATEHDDYFAQAIIDSKAKD